MYKKLLAATCAAILVLLILLAQSRAADLQSKTMSLTAQDYIDIQQLVASYGYAIDKCTNSGYDYADLYTPDGVFGIADADGTPGTVKYIGRDRLAQADGGGKNGCVDPKTVPDRYAMSHMVANLVIMPAPGGATGKSYLLTVTIGDPTNKDTANQPTRAYEWGRYDDFYVKTAKGWRFKTRTHVWPGMPASLRAH
jgi:SnoaL-like domain